jgi:GNAT superfamily N-acetyltransferase
LKFAVSSLQLACSPIYNWLLPCDAIPKSFEGDVENQLVLLWRKENQVVGVVSECTRQASAANCESSDTRDIHRRSDRADLPCVLRLYAENEITPDDVLRSSDAREIWERFSAYPDYKLYVARIAGEIVGTFALLIMDNLAHRGAKSGVVEDVIVSRKFQERGIGKQMMRFALTQCRDAGCYKLSLSSNLKRTAAHAFYESLGFVKHGYSFIAELK